MAQIQKQVRIVFDLNKCLGCQTCTMACKTMWTDRNLGQMYMYWNNVETRYGGLDTASNHGRGYPRDWWLPGLQGWAGYPDPNQAPGLGYQAIPSIPPDPAALPITRDPPTYSDPVNYTPDVHSAPDTLVGAIRHDFPLPPINPDYGAPWEYNYCQVLPTEGVAASSQFLAPSPAPNGPKAYSNNWDEDRGDGAQPNAYYFYLPRICNHCAKPACLASCPRQAIYKREEDGIVVVDQDRCRGYRYCNQGCPYHKVYYNPIEKKSQKCIFCYPRREDSKGFLTGHHSFCFTQCVGRLRYAGLLKLDEDPLSTYNGQFNVNRLVYEFGVALRLHPEFGTEPNLFYIPPLSAPILDANGIQVGTRRIPAESLAVLFGDDRTQTLAQRLARVGEILDKVEAARNGDYPELQAILIAHSEQDRLQLNLEYGP
jgi:Fe-S-cluster-containing dehydrogenase component